MQTTTFYDFARAAEVRALVLGVIAAAGPQKPKPAAPARPSFRPVSAFLRDVETGPDAPAVATSTEKIKAHLASLTRPQVEAVCAVAWLGRGDFTTYRAALAHAKDTYHAGMAEYVATKGPLLEYLKKGLEKAGF